MAVIFSRFQSSSIMKGLAHELVLLGLMKPPHVHRKRADFQQVHEYTIKFACVRTLLICMCVRGDFTFIQLS